ncbi:hypothetical protein B0H63DRAFT_390978, partial [Podospora didyma]
MFVPWESFLSETHGDINDIWQRQKRALSRRILSYADNIQLLRRSAEDVKRDARQWAGLSGDTDPAPDMDESALAEGREGQETAYRSDDVGSATRLIDVLRNTIGGAQVTAGSKEISEMVRQLLRFQQATMDSSNELRAIVILERAPTTSSQGAGVPDQEQLRSIKSQQRSVSREREKMIQGIHSRPGPDRETTSHAAAVYRVLSGFGEEEVDMTETGLERLVRGAAPSASIQFGPATSFTGAGRRLAESFTLNRKQSIALRLICRQLDRLHRDERGTAQLCVFVGGEGGTGKS